MVEFAQQLLTAHPAEAARAFVPLVSLFEEIVKAAAEAGAIKGALPHRAVVGTMLAVIMFNSFSATIAATPVQHAPSAAEELWAVLVYGLATRQGEPPTPQATTPANTHRTIMLVTAGLGRSSPQRFTHPLA